MFSSIGASQVAKSVLLDYLENSQTNATFVKVVPEDNLRRTVY
jgi:hypothetical protein